MTSDGGFDNHGSERLHDRLLQATGDRTFKRIGTMTNTHPETVRRYLSGHAPSVDFVSRLAEALGLNLNWILTGRGPMRMAEVKPHALRDANATDLLTHVALAIERLETKVDRLERYTQVLEIMIREGRRPVVAIEAKLRKEPEGESVVEQPATTTPEPARNGHSVNGYGSGPQSRAERIADALSERPRPDAG